MQRDPEPTDNRAHGTALAARLQRVWTKSDYQVMTTSAFFVMPLGEATTRLAIPVERRNGDALVAASNRIALAARNRAAISRKWRVDIRRRSLVTRQCRDRWPAWPGPAKSQVVIATTG